MSAPIGSKVYAYTVQPGTIVRLPTGKRFDVDQEPEIHGRFVHLAGPVWSVDLPMDTQVKVLGYFNVGRS
jgi:hypothetical protein